MAGQQPQRRHYDPEPIAWSNERSRTFSGLPPGDYEFQLQGRDYAGTPNEPQSLRFSIRPRWWQHPQT